jgi:hypothetical protein
MNVNRTDVFSVRRIHSGCLIADFPGDDIQLLITTRGHPGISGHPQDQLML